jgi:hypothetical protein
MEKSSSPLKKEASWTIQFLLFAIALLFKKRALTSGKLQKQVGSIGAIAAIATDSWAGLEAFAVKLQQMLRTVRNLRIGVSDV